MSSSLLSSSSSLKLYLIYEGLGYWIVLFLSDPYLLGLILKAELI